MASRQCVPRTLANCSPCAGGGGGGARHTAPHAPPASGNMLLENAPKAKTVAPTLTKICEPYSSLWTPQRREAAAAKYSMILLGRPGGLCGLYTTCGKSQSTRDMGDGPASECGATGLSDQASVAEIPPHTCLLHCGQFGPWSIWPMVNERNEITRMGLPPRHDQHDPQRCYFMVLSETCYLRQNHWQHRELSLWAGWRNVRHCHELGNASMRLGRRIDAPLGLRHVRASAHS